MDHEVFPSQVLGVETRVIDDFDILIPAHGESINQIEMLLQSIFLQETSDFALNKILLCSDNPKIIHHFAPRCMITTIKQEQARGKPNALNILIEQAEADVCIQNSADCLPASNWTYNHLLYAFTRNPFVGAVTSRPEPFNRGFMSLPNIVWKCHHFVQPKLSGELFAFKRRLFQDLPDEVVHDDAYIHRVIEASGYQVLYEPKAVVFNAVPESFSEFYDQRKKNVIGNMQLGDIFNIKPPGNLRLRSLLLMSIELLANVHGRLDYVRGKIPRGLVGYNLPSTKEVIK